MNTIDKLITLRSKYKITLKTRISRLQKQSKFLSGDSNTPNILAALKTIYDESHKLSGSTRPFGYNGLSEKVKKIQLLALQLLSDNLVADDNKLMRIEKLITQLDGEIEKDELGEINSPDWSLISETADNNAGDQHNRKVILIDEDETFTDQLSLQLEEYGYTVNVVYEFSKLQKSIDEIKPSSLILDSDLLESQPEYTHLLETLKNEYPHDLNIIYLSFDASFQARLKAIRAGAVGYFIKPFDIANFITFLNDKINRIDEIPLRVLIVDDDTEMAQFNAFALQQKNVRTFIVNEPLNSISAMVSFKPDILLVDIEMPHCNGFELAQVIRQNNEFINIPIIFLTGQHIGDAWTHSKISGGDDLILKDISTEHLVNTITARAKRSRTLIDAKKRAVERQARAAAFVKTVKDAIITMDDELRIQFWNKGAENLFGYGQQQVFGHHISILYPEKENLELKEALKDSDPETSQTPTLEKFSTQLLHKKGHKIQIDLFIIEWEFEGIKNYTGIYRDMSKS